MMSHWAVLLCAVVVGGSLFTGSLVPAVQTMADFTVDIMTGEKPFDDFEPKFIKVKP